MQAGSIGTGSAVGYFGCNFFSTTLFYLNLLYSLMPKIMGTNHAAAKHAVGQP
jgi:hypothetical protein